MFDSATLWTVVRQAPLSTSGLPCSLPGDLLDAEIEPTFLMSPALGSLPQVPLGKLWVKYGNGNKI